MTHQFNSLFADEKMLPFWKEIIWSAVENAVMYDGIDVSRLTDDELVNYSVVRTLGREGSETKETDLQERDESDETALYEQAKDEQVALEEREGQDAQFTTKHEGDLYGEAENFLDRGKYELSILLYATWVEHWINRIILMRSIGQGTPPEVATALIRSCRLELKIGRIWSSLGMPRFDKDLARKITRLMEARNGFVHYKWPSHSEERHDEERRRSVEIAHEAKKTVDDLIQLEDDVFYDGRTESLKRHIHETCVARQRAAAERQAEN
jgi:hypothetical protein